MHLFLPRTSEWHVGSVAMGENGDNSESLSKVKAHPRKRPSPTDHCQDVNGKCSICLAPGRADESPSALIHEQKYKQEPTCVQKRDPLYLCT